MAAPPSVGTSLPSINGQSVNTSCASLALTYVPTSRRSPTTVAVTRASRENDRAAPLMAPPSRGLEVTAARRDVRHVGDQEQRGHEVRGHPPGIELRRDDHGAEPRLGHHEREREDRRPEHGRVSTLRADRGEAGERREHGHEERHPRCENSMSEWTVPEGKRRPGSQPGQVEHPRPEPVPRTSPPIANSTTVAIAVASARVRKRERVDRHGDARMIVPPSRGLGLAILPLVTGDLRARVDTALAAFLDERRGRVERLDPSALPWWTRCGASSTPGASGSVPRSATGGSARPAARTARRSCAPRLRSSSCTRWRWSTTT